MERKEDKLEVRLFDLEDCTEGFILTFEVSLNEEDKLISKSSFELLTFFNTLKTLSFAGIPSNDLFDLPLSLLKEEITSFFSFLPVRADLVGQVVTQQFLELPALTVNQQTVPKPLIELKTENSLPVSSILYQPSLGALILIFVEKSVFTPLKQFFFSESNYSQIAVYGRKYDENNKPFFEKVTESPFSDVISAVHLDSSNRLFLGFQGGSVAFYKLDLFENLLNLRAIDVFNYSAAKVEDFASYKETLLSCHSSNKIRAIAMEIDSNVKTIDLSAQLEGKGSIKAVEVDEEYSLLFVLHGVSCFSLFSLKNEGELFVSFYDRYELPFNTLEMSLKPNSISVVGESQLTHYNRREISLEIVVESLEDFLICTKEFFAYLKAKISAFCVFEQMKLIILGTTRGEIVVISLEEKEVKFAKQMGEGCIVKVEILEENFVFYFVDAKGTAKFMKLDD